MVENIAPRRAIDSIPSAQYFTDFIAPFQAREIDFASLPFNHPFFILFSSGTTGSPKCILHGAGGILIENLKSLGLQFDVKPGDRVYWWTTTGCAEPYTVVRRQTRAHSPIPGHCGIFCLRRCRN